ncbi:MAG: hypothetical protein ABSH48_07040 [Verrucomicrobiota bacterium]
MKTAKSRLGCGACRAESRQKRPTPSEGKAGSEVNLGSAAGRTYCLAAGLMLLAPAASAQLVYAMEFNQSDNIFGTMNLLDGTFTTLGDEGSTLFNDIAAEPDGTLYGVVNGTSLVTLDETDGAISSSVSFSVGGIESLAVAPDGTLYGASQNALYTISTQTGAATLVGDFNNSLLNNNGQNIRFAPNGNLYDTDGGVNALNTDLFQISLANGQASLAGVINGFPGLCLENSGQVMYGVGIQIGAASTVVQDLVGIDLASVQPGGLNPDGSIAALSYVELTGNFPDNYNFTAPDNYTVPGMPVTPAPEPGALSSFLAGAALLLVLNRRPRR